MLKIRRFQISFFIGLSLVSSPALAYIDPGTGAMLVQAFLALLVSVLFYFDKFRSFLRRLIAKVFGKKQ